MTAVSTHPAAGRRVSGKQCSSALFSQQIFVTRSDVVLLSGIHRGEQKSSVVMTVLETLWGRNGAIVVLVIDSFGVGAMKDVTLVRRRMPGQIPVVTS